MIFGLASMKKIMDNISILKHMHQIGDYPAN